MKASSRHGRRIRILVVDDEPSVSRSIKMLLKHDGHEVLSVESGEAAMALYRPGKFDLIITDYSMPGMNGSQLIALIKRQSAGQRIVMITALAGGLDDFGERGKAADLVLDKPFTVADLRSAIARVLPAENAADRD